MVYVAPDFMFHLVLEDVLTLGWQDFVNMRKLLLGY